LGWPGPFPGPDAAKLNGEPQQQFDIISNNAVYNDARMRKYLKPHAFLFTVLRKPVDQAVSAFEFFHPPCETDWASRMDWLQKLQTLQGDSESLGGRGDTLFAQFLNPQAHDLGWYEHMGNAFVFDHEDSAIEKWIGEISNTLDFVMLAEAFDEGLLLLKQKLGLELDDIAYKYMKRGSQPVSKPSVEQAKKLQDVNHVDSKVYDHFAAKFWAEWKTAGDYEKLGDELKQLRSRNQVIEDSCASGSEKACPWSLRADTVEFTEKLKRKACL
jgi:hypothetical protein